jgi:glycosyltransferase involved in cell wall biosynthesis
MTRIGLPPRPVTASGTRVFVIGNGWWPERKGGAEAIFHGSLAALHRGGFAVCGVVPGSATVARDTAGRIEGFPASIPLARRAAAVRRLFARAVAEDGAELVASHFALYTLPVLDKLRHRPLIVHFHGPWALESQVEGGHAASIQAKRLLERLVYRRADRFIVLSEAFGRLAVEQYGIREEALRLAAGAIDTRRFDITETRPEARQRLGWVADRPVLFAVRRLVRRMGIGNLIEAMAILCRQPGPARDAVLYVAGTGAERQLLEAQAQQRGLADVVRFIGFIADEALPLAYRAADLTVMPSAALEGFGLAAAESLAAGTPALVTPVGGLPEVVAPLAPSLVLAGCEPGPIAAGLRAALEGRLPLPDPRACQHYAFTRFDWQVAGPRLAGIYREVL